MGNILLGEINPTFKLGVTDISIALGEVHLYPQGHDYSKDYFTMVVTSGGNITWSGSTTANTLSYSKDNGTTWTTADSGTTVSVAAGDKVLWKCEGTPTPQSNKGIGEFSGDTNTKYSVEGNAMSLLYGDDFKGQKSLSGKNYALCGLFSGNTNVTSAENLSLPATTLVSDCYGSMFYGCTNLTTAPELPATALTSYCYGSMFNGCTSLTTAPELPATTLADWCYKNMFHGCTSLTTAPELPATTLANYCYQDMFSNCASLTTAHELPATTLTNTCYRSMFYGCTSLTTAPELPATTLVNNCYYSMFQGCTSLTTAPELPATTLEKECYYSMFQNCTSLTTAPELPATTLTSQCYRSMFQGCTSLTTAPELPATTLAGNCYLNMFRDCTKLTTAPELLATTLADGCYSSMFVGCTSLTTAPELPALNLTSDCYREMFSGCTSLTTAPELPATTLVNNCYNTMFRGCSNLNHIKCLATDISVSNSTTNWVIDVSSIGVFVKNPDMTNWGRGSNGVPNNWVIIDEGTPIPVTGVSVMGSMYVQPNKTRSLNATVLPTYADNKNLTFQSSDTSILTVDENGIISGVSTGSTTIIITTAESGFTAQCNVSVIEYSNYTLIEYIESTQDGGQYIETNLNMWSVMPVEYEVDMGVNLLGLGKDKQNQAVILGNNREVSPYPGFVIRRNSNNVIEQNKNPKVTSYGNVGQYLDIHQQYTVSGEGTHNVTATLFCGKNSSGTPFRYSRTRLYYCKLRANSPTWQREFVPVKNEQDVIGLLDIVEGKFYKSPNDVEFIGGQEVSQ